MIDYKVMRATHCIEYTINIEGGVYNKRRIKNLVPEITSSIKVNVRSRKWEESIRGIGDIFIHVTCIIACCGSLIKVGHE